MKFLIILLTLVTLSFATIDINKADIRTLKILNEIGPKKAQAIIDFRKINCFKNVNNLKANQCKKY